MDVFIGVDQIGDSYDEYRMYILETNLVLIDGEEWNEDERTHAAEIIRRLLDLSHSDFQELFKRFYGRADSEDLVFFTRKDDAYDFVEYVEETYKKQLTNVTEEQLKEKGILPL